MHTSAQLPPEGVGEYTGILLQQAEARVAQIDTQGHVLPVLCLDLELDNQLHTRLHVEQPFLTGCHDQARAAAHRLTKGLRVTVQAPLISLRIVANSATHIHVHQPQEQPANGQDHHDSH
jgi:hypothetical protein